MFPGLFDQLLEVNIFRYISFRMVAATLSAFTSSVWVVYSVLRGTTSLRTKSHMTSSSRLTKRNQSVFFI